MINLFEFLQSIGARSASDFQGMTQAEITGYLVAMFEANRWGLPDDIDALSAAIAEAAKTNDD